MIQYQINQQHDFAEILSLYQAVGWTNYSEHPEMLQKALAGTLYTLTATNEKNELVGILRAVGDGSSLIFIQDIIVLPTYWRQGIGSRLLQQTLNDFKEVYMIQLLTDDREQKIAFYEKNGFMQTSKMNCTSFLYVGHSTSNL